MADAIYASLYTYDRNKGVIRAFCESWCPTTNTIHTAFGEASLSLWDLHKLGGLPLHGWFYDEVIPSTKELIGVGKLRYQKPPARKAKKSTRPKATHNPIGIVKKHETWASSRAKACNELGVKENHEADTYLVAFFSCWLCVFVFPSVESMIRPETFKIASLIATGSKGVNLAIPVLAQIYRGLNQIALSTQAGSSDACFPIHYVYGWLGYYFETHFSTPQEVIGPSMVKFSGEGGAKYFSEPEARNLIHTKLVWDANLYSKNRGEIIIDTRPLDPLRHDYLVSVRSSYLPVRCHNTIIVEPYIPHRFGRQFGFCQDVPGNLKINIRSGSVDDLLKFWQTCTLSNTQPRLISPARPLNINDQATASYMEWWSQVHNPYLEHSIEALIFSTHQTPSKRLRQQKERPSKIEQGENQMLVATNLSSRDKRKVPSKAKSLQLLPNTEQGILEKNFGHQGTIAIEDSDSETDRDKH
ncbi:uncharacterized protein LOC110428080 [Herrania umbratica]|uniref:Uncharacterized protein LOC110428080 n=1 Tax=Herrania umbratica TaxID=108875 RepID=A0A6J1BMD4_9ROSI|nr:uncharacterized protein LOC110428080 [Herrania umbratica]